MNGLAGGLECAGRGVGVRGIDDDAEADAHVEHAEHLGFVHVAGVLQEAEQRRHGPRAGVHLRVEGVGQGAVEVAGQAAAGDVRHAVDGAAEGVVVQQRADGADVDAGGLQQRLAQRAAACDGVIGVAVVNGVEVEVLLAGDGADEGVAVGVDAGGAEAEDDVALAGGGRAVDDAVELDHAHREAGQVVVAGGVDVGHLGGLAAQQRTIGERAAVGHAADDLLHLRGVDPVHADVVQEHQRLGALHDQVVDVHRHAVLTDGVVDAEVGGELDLGADAVAARDEHGLVVVAAEQRVAVEAEHPGKGAVATHDARAVRAVEVPLDPLNSGVARVDVDARGGVGHALPNFSHWPSVIGIGAEAAKTRRGNDARSRKWV